MSENDNKEQIPFLLGADVNIHKEFTFDENIRIFIECKTGGMSNTAEFGEAVRKFSDRYKEGEQALTEAKAKLRMARLETQSTESKPRKIITPPGYLVLQAAEFLCSRKDYERVFLQAVVDMREEYNQALSKEQKEKAQWVLIRGYLNLAWSVILQVVEFLLSGPAKIIKTLWTST